MLHYQVIIIGAGAAGLMCGIEAGKRGRSVAIFDHAKKVAEKIRISGGGRCNFTNIHTAPIHFLSANPHFCVSALRRYTPKDFVSLVERYDIPYHEKKHGQLFCDRSAGDIISMLVEECNQATVSIRTQTTIEAISKGEMGFLVQTSQGHYTCESLVMACGGLSIPKMGATGFGHQIARQFGLDIIPTRAALVPFTFDEHRLEKQKELMGVSLDDVRVLTGKGAFNEAILFTHRGLSGPAVLQASSYWRESQEVSIDLMPSRDVLAWLKYERQQQPRLEIQTLLAQYLPKRLALYLCSEYGFSGKMADLSNISLQTIANSLTQWSFIPCGTEGYRTAEVTLGGVNTDELSSKTMEAKKVPGLYFIGEVVDVTGHLGGFNFQWAWSSGFAAGQHV
ncbi:MAG: NAD(P)/FAD-dependent oxidoreductase [Alphaproteobacteria bacterium]|nr:NAD(P)/FAD-dependent oxidoreductase [Alphaproteobacteria bacterium]